MAEIKGICARRRGHETGEVSRRKKEKDLYTFLRHLVFLLRVRNIVNH